MRTLTQVWVFFISLTFLFLLIGFQLAGRFGLFVAFLASLFFLYATLHRVLKLFKRKLNLQKYNGNDPTGFIQFIEQKKFNFGFRKIQIYSTAEKSPPLVFKNVHDEGVVIINDNLLQHLTPEEVRLLALLLLSHLENRTFFLIPVLSIVNQSFFLFRIFSALISYVTIRLFKLEKDILKADQKFRSVTGESEYVVGYFLNRLHAFDFNRPSRLNGTEYFSVLSLPKPAVLNQFGIPLLQKRLKNIMGFAIQ